MNNSREALHADERRRIIAEFKTAVNMTSAQLHKWLATEDSQRVGQKKGQEESVGHRSGERIATLLDQDRKDFDDDDFAHMRKVVGFIHRHLAQGPTTHDPSTSDWRYSLMNWGHDPEKHDKTD
ncbi:MAG: DUF3140 domain-containing protein [Herminiimonas sp.]|nr:DUF3140 domain-containing protein [Herminiimonas sp.]